MTDDPIVDEVMTDDGLGLLGGCVNDRALLEHVFDVTALPVSGRRGHGRVVLIDVADYYLVAGDRWYINKRGYVQRNSRGRYQEGQVVYLHRLLMGDPRGVEIDHRNRCRTDNRRQNLREATRAQNNANHPRHRHNQTPFKGVRRTASGRYQARIRIDKREHYLGTFETPEAAARAYV